MLEDNSHVKKELLTVRFQNDRLLEELEKEKNKQTQCNITKREVLEKEEQENVIKAGNSKNKGGLYSSVVKEMLPAVFIEPKDPSQPMETIVQDIKKTSVQLRPKCAI